MLDVILGHSPLYPSGSFLASSIFCSISRTAFFFFMHWPVSVFQSSEGLSWAYLREGFVLGFFSPLTHNGLQLPVVGVWNTQQSISTNGCLKIQNFLFPCPRQLLVGAVSGCPFCPATQRSASIPRSNRQLQ